MESNINDIKNVKYCVKCGSILEVNSKFCSKCGIQIVDMDINDNRFKDGISNYLFLPRINDGVRKIIYYTIFGVVIILGLYLGINLLIYIKDIFSTSIDMSIVAYIIEYFMKFSKFIIAYLLFTKMHSLLGYREDRLCVKYKKSYLLLLELAYIICVFIASYPFIKVSTITGIQLIVAYESGSFVDVILLFKFSIFMVIIAKGIEYFIDNKILISSMDINNEVSN